VVHGETGLAFAPGDIGALADAVTAVLSDAAAAAERALAAQSRLAADFDWNRIAEATAAVYRRARPGEPVELSRPKIATGNAFEPVAAGLPEL
jgi:glycogen(starch) synthase